MFGFFDKKVKKEEFEQLKTAVQAGFNSAKQDVQDVSMWIKHLDSNNSKLKEEVLELTDEVYDLRSELENLKNVISLVGEKPGFKQRQTVFNKQTAVQGVLNGVQTAVQTAFLDNLSATERAIVFILVNSDMKLSYEDLAAMLGKSKATVRGQVNTIRQKSEGLIEEQIGENSRKRVFIPDKVKEILLKTGKVRVKSKREREKAEKTSENR